MSFPIRDHQYSIKYLTGLRFDNMNSEFMFPHFSTELQLLDEVYYAQARVARLAKAKRCIRDMERKTSPNFSKGLNW